MALTKVNEEMIEVSAKLQIGGRTFSAAEVARFESGTTGIILYAEVTTASRWTTCRSANGTSGYQVGAAKLLTVKAIVCATRVGATQSPAWLLYGDTDVGQDGAAAPTNPVYLSGFATNSVTLAQSMSSQNQQYGPSGSVIDFQVPATKYPCVRLGANTASAILYCFIDDV